MNELDACDDVGSATCLVRVIRQTASTILIFHNWRSYIRPQ